MPPLMHVRWESWECPVSLTMIFVLTAAVYLRGWLRLRSTSSNIVPAWGAGRFLFGLFLIWVAVASPIASCDEELLTVHMVQHLLLMTFAPPLILLSGLPMSLWHGLPRPFVHRVIGPLFRWPSLQRLARVLGNLTLCWLVATATLVGWHVPAVLALGVQSPTWHAVEQASFLGAGLLFWWPVVQPWLSVSTWPRWSLVLYLFLATLPCDILSGFLVFSDRVAYPVYLSTSRHGGLSVLGDQQVAGALMWTCVTIVYLVAGTMVTARLLSAPSAYDGLVPSESAERAGLRRDPPHVEVV
jgi:putative membrane protein